MFNFFNAKEKNYKEFAELYNMKVKKSGKNVYVIRDNNAIKVKFDAYFNDAVTLFSYFFNQIEPEKKYIGFKKINVIDFTKPKIHKLKDQNLSFNFTSFAEGMDVSIGYLKKYDLKEGDVVFDCGAYCGISSYYFSKLVGETGKVYAFEPDKLNYEMLLKNIELHNLKNVIPINKGIWSKSDTLIFNTEGGLGSALVNILDRETEVNKNKIDVVCITDIIKEYNIPKVDFVKMDIEGAEIEAIKGIKDYLKDHDINFAIASYHILDNERTYIKLESIFKEIGYYVETIRLYSSQENGSLTTYASKKPFQKQEIHTEEIEQLNDDSCDLILSALKKNHFKCKLDILVKKLKNKKIIIYGTGKVCDVIFDNFNMSDFNIVAVSDKKYKDETQNYRGISAIPPEKIAEKNPYVVLTTLQDFSLVKNYFENELFNKNKKFKYRSIFNCSIIEFLTGLISR